MKPYPKSILNFGSSEDIDKEREMHLESDNIEKMIYHKGDEVIK